MFVLENTTFCVISSYLSGKISNSHQYMFFIPLAITSAQVIEQLPRKGVQKTLVTFIMTNVGYL